MVTIESGFPRYRARYEEGTVLLLRIRMLVANAEQKNNGARPSVWPFVGGA